MLTGWNYAKISDVTVHRVHDGVALQDDENVASLVFADGCRNPSYRILAPANPWRDAANALITNFDFRVFMFQSMRSGDAIMITANVVACVEEIDCAPVRCDRDVDAGYGRRRRRSLNDVNRTKHWEENLELKIRLPQDLTNGESLSILTSPLTESECKLYLIVTLATALTFCVLSAVIVLIACVRRVQEVKRREQRRQKAELEAKELQERQEKEQKMEKIAFALYQNNNNRLNGAAPPQNKPVTVRSVKRRDKAKQQFNNSRLCNNNNNANFVANNSNNVSDDEDGRAVMV